jgi:hypothetical protein
VVHAPSVAKIFKLFLVRRQEKPLSDSILKTREMIKMFKRVSNVEELTVVCCGGVAQMVISTGQHTDNKRNYFFLILFCYLVFIFSSSGLKGSVSMELHFHCKRVLQFVTEYMHTCTLFCMVTVGCGNCIS